MSILNSFALTGKVAIVTGASTGLGQGMALGLAEAGCDIVGVDYVDMPDTRKAVLEQGRRFLSIVADLVAIHPDGLKKIVEDAVATFGKIDILVNNAGITRDGLAMRMKDDDWNMVLAVNLTGSFYCARAAVKTMLRQRAGRIINIASVVGVIGNAGQANYAASKAGVIGMT
ncbi:MAG TPA: beta-ketoacyl-ACP reductase, partial [Acholeplasmatales bacterium]|nr:beta-ketoacyl-ACP reductase [Acholeplasmatales bacterium]